MNEDKRLNEVIRVQKRPNNFVMLDKDFLENSNLSWKAKGILAYLLSKPDNWKVIARDLVNHATDGKGSVYKGLNELKELGYYKKTPIRDEKGVFVRWDSVVFEVPNAESLENGAIYPLPKNPEMDNPDMDNPFLENQERNNNYINNNYKTFNNIQSSQSVNDGQDTTDNIAREIETYTELIKHNIAYDSLTIARPLDVGIIDEFLAIIIDVLMTAAGTVRINGENKPRELVIHNLLLLNYNDINHAIDQFGSVTERISKKKQYIITLLYNCKMEINSHYTNLVQHNMWNRGDCL